MNLQAAVLVPATPPTEVHLPALIAVAGDRAALRFLEFFTVNIRNRNTRVAYARAAVAVCAGAKGKGLANSPRAADACRRVRRTAARAVGALS